MSKEILFCNKCKKYTMKESCCGEKTITLKPAKYSPEDKWGKYRREFKESIREKNIN
ncbi:ribosome biogenesis protein [Candidatus Pacearchaeota archaeon]|nr:ribosome biogenesis protein [Candidatus Pacearchaeota archaeon]